MRVTVAIAAFNESKNLERLMLALLAQSRMPDEIVIVDDGSTDDTSGKINNIQSVTNLIKYVYQSNAGPAKARNNAWKNASGDICVFTDGDCVPSCDWIEKLIGPFSDESIAATGGTYKTLNTKSMLARFIGMEIAWKYRNVRGQIDVHGSYNLAVRRKVLEELNGYDESYPLPSGEDWDLTYRISRKYKIIYVPDSVVGHYHPEHLWAYMNNQVRRGFDRVKLYKDHPEKIAGDAYTPWYIKYQVIAAGTLLPSCILLYPLFHESFLLPAMLLLFLVSTIAVSTSYYVKQDAAAALYGAVVQFLRVFAWFVGLIKGIFRFGVPI
jgi:glycosyltransferase involved in cell wall biosynthesis